MAAIIDVIGTYTTPAKAEQLVQAEQLLIKLDYSLHELEVSELPMVAESDPNELPALAYNVFLDHMKNIALEMDVTFRPKSNPLDIYMGFCGVLVAMQGNDLLDIVANFSQEATPEEKLALLICEETGMDFLNVIEQILEVNPELIENIEARLEFDEEDVMVVGNTIGNEYRNFVSGYGTTPIAANFIFENPTIEEFSYPFLLSKIHEEVMSITVLKRMVIELYVTAMLSLVPFDKRMETVLQTISDEKPNAYDDAAKILMTIHTERSVKSIYPGTKS